jgi:hypothetical protein
MRSTISTAVIGGGIACITGATAYAHGHGQAPQLMAAPAHGQAGAEVRAAHAAKRVDKADILFVIDNSNSMSGEQALLRAQFPKLIETLTSGQRGPGDGRRFDPLKSVHLGVVSTDMGIPGVEYPPCHADGGDDGRLRHSPHPGDGLQCDADYPQYLSYLADRGQDVQKLASDFACVASLGIGGCGFEQQLEAPFKALWPSVYRDATGEVKQPNPYGFIATTVAGTLGKGDVPESQGGNEGFLRNDPDDPSLIAIVLVTDEEDCSVVNTDHLKPSNQLPEDSPYRSEDINQRCFRHPEFLYAVKERYLNGLRMLRPGREDLVVFTAIVGVPPDLVDRDALADVDFDDAASRSEFYDNLLSDQRMQITFDANTGTGQGNVNPSCVRASATGDGTVSTAYPPRRIVELARGFGEYGRVASICADDFEPAIDTILDAITKPLGRR